MVKRTFPLSKVYGLLEPGPVVLVTTAYKGRANIMTMSWHTMMEFEPPIVGCVISNRGYAFSILKQTKECVINIPTVELVAQVVGCGNTSGRDVDKFKVFQLTPTAPLKKSLAGRGLSSLFTKEHAQFPPPTPELVKRPFRKCHKDDAGHCALWQRCCRSCSLELRWEYRQAWVARLT